METDAAQAIEALIENYGKLVFHVIYGLTGNWQESEDLTQEAYMHALQGIEAARAKAGAQFQAKAWLLKVAVNTVRMAQRRQHLVRFISFADLQPKGQRSEHSTAVSPAYEEIMDVEDMETTIAERDVVAQCLQRLPATLRAPLLFSIVVGFSTSEIAGMLDVREATVRQRLVRARKSFQRLYAQESGEHLFIGEPVSRSRSRASRSRDQLLHRPAALLPAAAF